MRGEWKARRKYASKGATLEDLVKEKYGPVTGDEVMAWVTSHSPGENFQRTVQIVWGLKRMYEAGVLEIRGDDMAFVDSEEEPWTHRTIERAGLGDLW